MLRKVVLAAALFAVCHAAGAADMVVVEKGRNPAPILLPEKAPPATTQAAKDLADYIEKTSGARPEILATLPDPLPKSAIWVGVQPKAAERFKGVKLEFDHPEEILLACNGTDLLIAGRDLVLAGKQMECGTANAVYTFLQKHLGVRLLWPGPSGEDVLKCETVTLAPFDERFHPAIRQRSFRRMPAWGEKREPTEAWWRFQRARGSLDMRAGHAFTDWWEKYGKDHPDYFALRGDGTRAPDGNRVKDVKQCTSNPKVAAQWLENAELTLKANPQQMMVSGSPNDGDGFCTCENCRAQDHPANPESLTDRHVKFWNTLARGLRERFPEREVYVGAWAYATYRQPPIAEVLDKNIAIGYVGGFPVNGEEARAKEKAAWLGWADKATLLVYRPNLFWYSGGMLGLPNVCTRKTSEDIRFLAENKCVGIDIDSMPESWATQAPQHYLMAQLAYDPFQDAQALMKDYYQRGFGPAGADIEAYFALMEEAHEATLTHIQNSPGAGALRNNRFADAIGAIYTDAFLQKATDTLARAAQAVRDLETYRERVAFIQTGYEHVRNLAETVRAMNVVRESRGVDAKAVERAIELCAARSAYFQKYRDTFVLNVRFFDNYNKKMAMDDYLGPPSEEFVKTAREGVVELKPAVWKLAFQDDFNRGELGDDWKVLRGKWSVEDGHLVSTGGVVLSTRKFPGLQRVEFEGVITPNPKISDMSPFIHAGEKGHSSGYMLQFGGYNNTVNALQRMRQAVSHDRETHIEPGKAHTMVAEYDGSYVRLIVDGKPVLEYQERSPLLGPEHEQIGFYLHEGALKIKSIRVYTSEAIRK